MLPDKSEDRDTNDKPEGILIFLNTRRRPAQTPEAELTQGNLFEEPEQKVTTFENVLTMASPIIQTVKGKREWTCTFSAPPDLWHQDRNELVHARARGEETVKMANHARLQAGDFATIRGIVTQEQELKQGERITKLTYLNLTEVRPGLRASNTRVHGRAKKKDG